MVGEALALEVQFFLLPLLSCLGIEKHRYILEVIIPLKHCHHVYDRLLCLSASYALFKPSLECDCLQSSEEI